MHPFIPCAYTLNSASDSPGFTINALSTCTLSSPLHTPSSYSSKEVPVSRTNALPSFKLASPPHTPSSHPPLMITSSLDTPPCIINFPSDELASENSAVSIETFLPILRNCKNLAQAKHLHLHLCSHGLENDEKIVNYIVPMFVACGSMRDAQQAISRSSHCNVFSRTRLIQGYIDRGDFLHALNLYEGMQENFMKPSEHTYVALLKACAKQKWIERGWELHLDIEKMGIGDVQFVGNTLVGMYAKCGTILDAESVFVRLPDKDVVSWNALLSGYSEHGWLEEILQCIEEMESEGTSPDTITFTCGIKACTSEEALTNGQVLHVEIIKRGFETDDIICSALVFMYTKCGALVEAHRVFDELANDDEFAWNFLMAAYVERGFFEEVMLFSAQMLHEGTIPNESIFLCSLKVCGIMEAKDKGQEFHSELVKRGCDDEDFIRSTLVGMYAKLSLLADAQKVFDQVAVQDLVCWTALISGYAESGQGEEALACYEQMHADHLCACPFLFSCALKACCSLADLSKGREIHADIVKAGVETDSFIVSTMVDLYAKCGMLEEAQQVFDSLLVHDSVTWTTLIAGYVENGLGEEALNCIDTMKASGVCPDTVVLVASLKVCASTGSLDRGRALHDEAVKLGFENEHTVGIALVDTYGKCGILSDANMVFSKLVTRDTVAWNSMIAGYVANGLLEEALSSFQQMQLSGVLTDPISWNSILMGFAEQGESKEAYILFTQMMEQGVLPNDVIFLSVLKACGNTSSLQIGKRIHAHVCGVHGGVASSEANVSTILIEMYSKCGSMESAQELFDMFTPRHVRMWDVLIRGYTRQADFQVVSDLLRKMTQEGISPDDVLFLNILNVCVHLGFVEMGQNCFHAMTQEYSISPTSRHHTCMVSLLCRAGQLDEAAVLIEKMPTSPNLIVWSSLLDACRTWGNVELGRWAFERAMSLDGLDSSPFISMSNIYSDAGMYDAAKSIDDLRLKWTKGRTRESLEKQAKEGSVLHLEPASFDKSKGQ